MTTEPHRSWPLAGRDFAAVLFDFDGTLVDSLPAVERSWRAWAEHYEIDLARLAELHGVPSKGVIAALLPPELAQEAHDWIEAREVSDTDGIVVLPGAAETLAGSLADVRLTVAGGRVAVAPSTGL